MSDDMIHCGIWEYDWWDILSSAPVPSVMYVMSNVANCHVFQLSNNVVLFLHTEYQSAHKLSAGAVYTEEVMLISYR